MDAPTMDALMAALLAAARKVGCKVLTRGEDAAADGLLGLGNRLLTRLRKVEATRPALDQAVQDVAQNPDDEDFEAALRAQVKKALKADLHLEADLGELLKAAGTVVHAEGERSVAVQHNSGIIATGDDVTIERR
jgi:hypothetical protein